MSRPKGSLNRGRFTADWWSEQVTETENGCFVWTGLIDVNGYGVVSVNRANRRAHRVLFEQVRGQVPDGLELDHLCRTKACVNPLHLQPVTHKENMQRAYARKTHCAKGHPYTTENVGFRSNGWGRYCRICARENQRRIRERRAA